jgi:hypothetical protein
MLWPPKSVGSCTGFGTTTTRKIGFRNAYLKPVFKKQVLKGESGIFIYFIKIIRTGFV